MRLSTHIWSTIAENNVRFPAIELRCNKTTALGRSNVRHNRLHVADGSDGKQIDAKHNRTNRHILGRNLAPSAWSCTQVHTNARLGQKVEPLVDLDELERGTGAVALILRQMVVLILVVALLVGRHGNTSAIYQYPPSRHSLGQRISPVFRDSRASPEPNSRSPTAS